MDPEGHSRGLERCSEQTRRKAATQSHGTTAVEAATSAGPPAGPRVRELAAVFVRKKRTRQMNGRSTEGRWSRGGRQRRGPRRPEVERLERDSFILLQHVYTVTGADPEVPVSAAHVGAQLGFAEDESARLVRYLSWIGFMKESAAGPHLALAPEGIHYLEHGAGRRRSVRADEKEVPIPVFLSH